MLTLVYKDLVVQRIVILVYLAVAVLFSTPVFSVSAPVVVVAMLAMTFTFATASQDERANSHILLNSLPVTRREIVTAKYVFHIIASLCFIGLAVLFEAAFAGLTLRAALSRVLIAMDVIVWFLAIFYPMYYGLGPRFVQVGMFVFLFSLATIAPTVYNVGVKHNFWGILDLIGSLPPIPLYLLWTAVTLIVLAGSWRVSVGLYNRKEF